MNLTGVLTISILLLPMCGPATAHSLTLTPNGILRTKAGKLDLAAPAPRKPDDKPNLSKISQADPQNAKLSVIVYVEDSIGDSSLARIRMEAQGIASQMFATAGVHIDWRTGQPKADEPERPILIDITSNTPETFYRGALGYAHVFEGFHIRIFYDRVRKPDRPRATAMLLAHVLVHEITHILEGVDRHSEEGVMKARWTVDDLVQMQHKPLPFNPQDVRLIRGGVVNRTWAAKRAPLRLISPTASN